MADSKQRNGQGSMTNSASGRHIRVKFGPSEWIGFAGLIFVLMGIGVGVWTRLAIIETRVDDLGRRFEKIESRAERHERSESRRTE
jgi:hypothetical protein